MASLSLSNSEIYRDLSLVMGVSRDKSQWDAQTLADAHSIIRSGRRKFYAAYEWSFLTHAVAINVVGPYSTGTITVANGVATLAGGTWPNNAAGQRLAFGDALYEVSTRDSGTQLTLFDTSVDAAAGTTFKLYSTRYALPTSFGAFVGPVTVEAIQDGCEYLAQETAVLPEFDLRRLLSRATAYETEGSSLGPIVFSVTQTLASTEIGLPVYVLDLYPLPDQDYTLRAMVRIAPGDSLSEADATELVHPSFAELMRLAIMSAAEVMYNGQPGVNTGMFQQELPRYIKRDKTAAGARRMSPRRDWGRDDPLYQLRIAPVNIL